MTQPTHGALRQPLTMVVFDMDGVLYDFVPSRRLAKLVTFTSLDPEWMQAVIWGSDFERGAESGAYPTGEGYLAEFNRRLGCAITREQWVEARRAAMTPRLEMFAIVDRLRRRMPCVVLTNNGALVRDTLPALVPELWELLGDRIHVSADFNARKPDPVVFRRLVERYGQPAASVLFIDDEASYVEGARTAGLQAVQYESTQQVAALCASLG